MKLVTLGSERVNESSIIFSTQEVEESETFKKLLCKMSLCQHVVPMLAALVYDPNAE